MKRSRFSEEQIIGILKEHEAGVSVADPDHHNAAALIRRLANGGREYLTKFLNIVG